jgi:hypothetical protein
MNGLPGNLAVATDRALIKVNGQVFTPTLQSFRWAMSNNATIENVMSTDRTSPLVTYGNVSGNSTIDEIITEGSDQVNWIQQDMIGAVIEVHPASNSWQAPKNTLVYNGQVRLLTVLAVGDMSESYPGAGRAAIRSVSFLLSEVDYM